MNLRLPVSALVLLGLFPHQLQSQNVSVDENSFRIYLNGAVVGHEQFSIRQVGPGDQQRLILTGSVELDLPDGRIELAPAMDVQGSTLGVSKYQIKVSGTETTDISVNASENRFLARVVSSSGEQLREFRAGPGSVLLDDGVIHHYYLLNPFLDEESPVPLTVLSPREMLQERMTLSLVGQDEIRVGGILVSDARRYHLEGGDHPREIWFDSQGRVLRIEIPSQGYVAERESLT